MAFDMLNQLYKVRWEWDQSTIKENLLLWLENLEVECENMKRHGLTGIEMRKWANGMMNNIFAGGEYKPWKPSLP